MEKKLFVCLSSEYKGNEFLRRLHDNGHEVFLVTSKVEADKDWAWPAIKDTFYLDRDDRGKWDDKQLTSGFSWLMRANKVDRIVALDDFEVERAAHLREVFRMPGMGETTSRHFRDKLAMRVQARDNGLAVPEFASLFNDADINHYLDTVPFPHVIKPRSEASASGIKKVYNKDEAWGHIHTLEDNRVHYLIERFVQGAVYHVDGLVYNNKVLFTACAQYRDTPFEVAHGGGIFQSLTLDPKSKDSKDLTTLNTAVMKAFNMKHGAFHSEYIRSEADGQYYFLETASRVGGANLADMVDKSTGINLWAEWAQIESDLLTGKKYSLPKKKYTPAGIIVSLSRYQHMPEQAFKDSEVVWRMNKDYHVGVIVANSDPSKVVSLLDQYAHEISVEYHASLPPKY